MQQISPPLRIALVAIALLGAVWFVALRPTPDTSADAPLPAAPGVAGLTRAEQSAKNAVSTANKAAAGEQATHHGAADETAASGDQDLHVRPSAQRPSSGRSILELCRMSTGMSAR